jgi:hypothetical protein
MSITSSAFGRVQLTKADAVKFKNQVTYGRPKKAAATAVAEGLKLSEQIRREGAIKIKLKSPAS